MTPTEAWAVVRPDGEVVLVHVSRSSLFDDPERDARIHAEALGDQYRAVRVRIEEMRE